MLTSIFTRLIMSTLVFLVLLTFGPIVLSLLGGIFALILVILGFGWILSLVVIPIVVMIMED